MVANLEGLPTTEMTDEVKSKKSRFPAIIWVLGAVCLVGALVASQWMRSRSEQSSRGDGFIVSHTAGKLVTGGYSGWIGFQMTIGAEPINVTALGRMVVQENTAAHTLKLIDVESGADVPGGSVEIVTKGKPPGQMAYGILAAPVTLKAGAAYYLVSSESVTNNKGDFFYDYNSPVQTTAAASVDHPVFFEAGQWRRVGGANETFGPLDFRYTKP